MNSTDLTPIQATGSVNNFIFVLRFGTAFFQVSTEQSNWIPTQTQHIWKDITDYYGMTSTPMLPKMFKIIIIKALYSGII